MLTRTENRIFYLLSKKPMTYEDLAFELYGKREIWNIQCAAVLTGRVIRKSKDLGFVVDKKQIDGSRKIQLSVRKLPTP